MEREIRQLQIIVGGLIAGLLSFGAVAGFLGPLLNSRDAGQMQFVLLGIPVMGAACAVAFLAQRRALQKELRDRRAELQDAATLPAAYRRYVVAGGGLIEGPGMFATIGYLLTGHPLAAGAAGLAVMLLILHLPSLARWERLVEDASLS
jgi:hypothetical protein